MTAKLRLLLQGVDGFKFPSKFSGGHGTIGDHRGWNFGCLMEWRNQLKSRVSRSVDFCGDGICSCRPMRTAHASQEIRLEDITWNWSRVYLGLTPKPHIIFSVLGSWAIISFPAPSLSNTRGVPEEALNPLVHLERPPAVSWRWRSKDAEKFQLLTFLWVGSWILYMSASNFGLLYCNQRICYTYEHNPFKKGSFWWDMILFVHMAHSQPIHQPNQDLFWVHPVNPEPKHLITYHLVMTNSLPWKITIFNR